MSNIHFQVDIPCLPQKSSQTNYRIDSVKKNLLNDMLTFNMQAFQQQRKQKYQRSLAERKQSQRMNQQLERQAKIDKQLQVKRKILLRQSLIKEYDHQIKAQKEIKRREKQIDQQYKKIQLQSNTYQDQRRLNELMRMYRGSRFEVSDAKKSSNSQYKVRDQVKTEPSQEINTYERKQLRSQQRDFNYQRNNYQRNKSLEFGQEKKFQKVINPQTPKSNQNIHNKNNYFQQYQDQQKQRYLREESRMRNRNFSFNNIQQVKIEPSFSKHEIDSLDYLKYIEDKRKRQYKQQLDDQIKKKSINGIQRYNRF